MNCVYHSLIYFGAFLTWSILAQTADDYGYARWHYLSSNPWNPTEFITGQLINLEYVSEASVDGTGASNVASSVEWSTTASDCVIKSSGSGFSANMTCSSAGSKKVQIARDGSTSDIDSFYIDVTTYGSCGYAWYWTISSNWTVSEAGYVETTADASSTINYRIWIVSDQLASSDELTYNAAVPSANSAQLTKQYQFSGEAPQLSIISNHGVPIVNNVNDDGSDLTFDYENSYWYGSLRTSYAELAYVDIQSKGVISFGCLVEGMQYEVSVVKWVGQQGQVGATASSGTVLISATTSFITEYEASPLSVSPSFSLYHDACAPNLMIALLPPPSSSSSLSNNQRHFLWTDNHFRTSALVQPDLSQSPGVNLNTIGTGDILQIAFGNQTLVFLTNTSIFYVDGGNDNNNHAYYNLSTFTPELVSNAGNVNNPQLHNFPLDNIRSQGSCSTSVQFDCTADDANKRIVAWASTNVTSFYISQDDGVSFSLIQIKASLLDGVTQILDIQSVNTYNTINVLVAKSDEELILQYQLFTQEWSLGYAMNQETTRVNAGVKNSEPHMVVSESGSGYVYIYGDSVVVSSNGGLTGRSITLRSRNNQQPASGLVSDEYITILSSSTNAHWACLTSYSRLFISADGLTQAWEIQSGLARGVPANLYLNAIDQLFVTTLSNTSPYVHVREVPWRTDLTSPRVPISDNPEEDVSCPYINQSISLEKHYYLDMGESLPLVATLLSSAAVSNAYSLSTSDKARLAFTTSYSIQAVSTEAQYSDSATNLVEQRVTATVSESSDPAVARIERENKALGEAAFVGIPVLTNLGCETAIQTVAKVRIGCPPGRHIRIRHSTNCLSPSTAAPTEASEGLSHCDGIDRVPLGEAFDSADYGCAEQVYQQTDGYRPIVDLYDGNNFVKEVTANYVVWEVFARSDWGHNASNSDVGCVSQPTTFNEIIANGGSMDEWYPEDTHDCFSYDSTRSVAGSDDYQIMNSTGESYINFPLDGDGGLFYFKLRVIDPDYSYCDLTAKFAINVYGAPLDTLTVVYIVLGVSAAIVLILILTYVHYRRVSKLEIEAEAAEEQRLINDMQEINNHQHID